MVFYSRPKIEPLGWDFKALPEPSGAKNYHAVTIDNRPVDFRFSGGWLIAKRGPVGTSHDDYSAFETVLEVQIAPLGVMEILPEQICDLLGCTVLGTKFVDEGKWRYRDMSMDWSGRTTYWDSNNHMSINDAIALTEDITTEFPESRIVQISLDSSFSTPRRRDKLFRCREIPYPILSDQDWIIALQGSKGLDVKVMCGQIKIVNSEGAVSQTVFLNRSPLADDGGVEWLEKHRGDASNLDYRVKGSQTFVIQTEYQTADVGGQKAMEKLLHLMDRHLCTGVQYSDLQTKAVFREKKNFYTYSRDLKAWCLEKPNRYLRVGVETAEDKKSKKERGEEIFTPGDETVFFGLRPLV